MKKTLAPIYQREWYSSPIERELIAFLEQTIFHPLLEATEQPARLNEDTRPKDHSALWDALLAGIIWFSNGVFYGAFDSAISRELRAMGARRTGENFYLPVEQIPIALRGVLALSAARSTAIHESILTTLNAIEEHIQKAPTGFSFEKEVDNVVSDLQEQLVQSVSSVEGLAPVTPVPAGFSGHLREVAATDLDRAIKNFSAEQTRLLRERVRKNLSEGGRVDRLSKVIETEFGVSKRKARFLADQETSLLVSKFRETRYRDLGCTDYIWETAHDEKVRPTHGESNNHRILDGRKFSWGSPPVVDSATGRRCHPGEDYGPCRCVARPVINFFA